MHRSRAMEVLVALLVGLTVGLLARLLAPARDPGGAVATMLLGAAGAQVAYLLSDVVGLTGGEVTPRVFLVAIVGSTSLLAIYLWAIRR